MLNVERLEDRLSPSDLGNPGSAPPSTGAPIEPPTGWLTQLLVGPVGPDGKPVDVPWKPYQPGTPRSNPFLPFDTQGLRLAGTTGATDASALPRLDLSQSGAPEFGGASTLGPDGLPNFQP